MKELSYRSNEKQWITENEYIELVRGSRQVYIQSGSGEPQKLINCLVNNKEKFHDLVIISTPLPFNKIQYLSDGTEGHFYLRSFFTGSHIASAMARGQAEYIPCHLSRIPQILSSESIKIDIVLILVSPPDRDGYVNLGANIDYVRTAIKNGSTIIAEINDQVPRINGDTRLNIGEIDFMMPSDEPVIEAPPPHVGSVEQAVGRNVAEFIPDKAVVQIGIGSVAEAVLQNLGSKKDLGIHSGLISDTMVELARAGVINGKYKSIQQGLMVAAMLVGTGKTVYAFCSDNPNVELYPVTWTHNPITLSKIDRFVSVNSALQVDLSGQANCEVLNGQYVGGVGGIVDFMRGAGMSMGGRSIIALPSTAGQEKYSRIVSKIPDAVVTCPRTDIDYVATEYGVACLSGKGLAQRAEALIRIAHPDFRAILKKEFIKTF
ncbi:MAG: acetyl-CoA hydrolase/transferase family protein [Bacillota bacterium]